MTAWPVPAAANSGREITISDWKPYEKNTLRGFFTATLPSGLVFHNLMLHEKNGKRWVSFPARSWKNAEGEQQWAPYIEFRDGTTADKFRDGVLVALDKHLAAEALR